MEHFFHSKNSQELGVMSQQLLALCEFFSPGALAAAQEVPKLNQVISESSRGLFRRKRK